MSVPFRFLDLPPELHYLIHPYLLPPSPPPLKPHHFDLPSAKDHDYLPSNSITDITNLILALSDKNPKPAQCQQMVQHHYMLRLCIHLKRSVATCLMLTDHCTLITHDDSQEFNMHWRQMLHRTLSCFRRLKFRLVSSTEVKREFDARDEDVEMKFWEMFFGVWDRRDGGLMSAFPVVPEEVRGGKELDMGREIERYSKSVEGYLLGWVALFTKKERMGKFIEDRAVKRRENEEGRSVVKDKCRVETEDSDGRTGDDSGDDLGDGSLFTKKEGMEKFIEDRAVERRENGEAVSVVEDKCRVETEDGDGRTGDDSEDDLGDDSGDVGGERTTD